MYPLSWISDAAVRCRGATKRELSLCLEPYSKSNDKNQIQEDSERSHFYALNLYTFVRTVTRDSMYVNNNWDSAIVNKSNASSSNVDVALSSKHSSNFNETKTKNPFRFVSNPSWTYAGQLDTSSRRTTQQSKIFSLRSNTTKNLFRPLNGVFIKYHASIE